MKQYGPGPTKWLDIQLDRNATPDHPALKKLVKAFNLHPITVKKIINPSTHSAVEDYGEYLFMTYHFPVYDPVYRVSRRSEIDFLITKDLVATIHYEPLHALEFAAEQCSIDDEDLSCYQTSLSLTYQIISHLLNFNERQIRHVGEKVESIAEHLFHNEEEELLRRISYIKRDIAEYRIIFNPIGRTLDTFKEIGVRFFGDHAFPYLLDLHDSYLRIHEKLENYRGAMQDYDFTNNQLLNVKAGEIGKRLTMMSFMTFPLVLIATLFAVDLPGVPFKEHPYGFVILIIILLAIATGFLLYFKKQKWF